MRTHNGTDLPPGCPARGDESLPCVMHTSGPEEDTCKYCGRSREHLSPEQWRYPTWYEDGCPCHRCGKKGAEERYSLGIYAGRWCDACWKQSGYRDEPASAFDPMDAGERYDDDY